jgi:acetylornithine/N-succinyldiaminopimelate aminotransferase
MLAIEIEKDGSKLVDICLKNGLLINCTHENVIRIMPAINVKKEEIDEGIEILRNSLKKL